MEKYNLKDMKNGYFLGDFEPTAYASKGMEISVKHYKKGTLDAGYYRKKNTEIVYIIKGCIDVDGSLYKKQSILVWKPNEIINIYAVKDSELLIIKTPGEKEDFNKKEFSSYCEVDSFYSGFFKKIEQEYFAKNEVVSCYNKIASKDVSVVVQGYADENTRYTIESIRRYMPEATIILSTWKECDVRGLAYDLLVVSEDPGAVDCSRWEEQTILNNGNRQIVSTKNGLDVVKTKYALKLRSDLILLGDGILSYFGLYEKERDLSYSLFGKRVIIGELFTRKNFVYHRENRKYDVPKPFHPSDWFAFGLTEDLQRLFCNVSTIEEGEMANYLCKYPDRVIKNKYKYSWRYCTEQHIFWAAVRKQFPNLQFKDWTDWNDENIEFSNNIMINNFMILNFCQHQILNIKYARKLFLNSGVCYQEEKLMTHKYLIEQITRDL